MATTIQQNLSTGRYAVALVGYRGWRRDSAIGDGITSATSALVTRCRTKAEAVRIAAELNESQPSVMAGSPDVPVYQALPYRRDDYLSRQDRANGSRDVDRRIAGV